MSIDWTVVSVEIFKGLINLAASAVVAYLVYRFERRREAENRRKEAEEDRQEQEAQRSQQIRGQLLKGVNLRTAKRIEAGEFDTPSFLRRRKDASVDRPLSRKYRYGCLAVIIVGMVVVIGWEAMFDGSVQAFVLSIILAVLTGHNAALLWRSID